MPWTPHHTNLRNRLSQLFPAKDQINMIATMAGLDTSQIKLEGSATTTWFKVIEHADTRKQMVSFLDACIMESGNDAELLSLKNELLKTQEPKPSDIPAPNNPNEPRLNQARKKARINDLKGAIELLINLVETNPDAKRHLNTVYGLSARFNRNEMDKLTGGLSNERYTQVSNQIMHSLLGTIDQIERDLTS